MSGDEVLLEDIFGKTGSDRFHRAASHIHGVMSILISIAANKSIASGMLVRIKDLAMI